MQFERCDNCSGTGKVVVNIEPLQREVCPKCGGKEYILVPKTG